MLVRCKDEHGFCKVETDHVSSIGKHAIRLLNPRVRRARLPEAFWATVAEISSEEGWPVENRTSAVKDVVIVERPGATSTRPLFFMWVFCLPLTGLKKECRLPAKDSTIQNTEEERRRVWRDSLEV